MFSFVDEWLDGRPAVRSLSDVRVAHCVQQAMKHFSGKRYHLLGWCVMPSHLHWVFQPTEKWCEEIAVRKKGERRGVERQAGSLHHVEEARQAGSLPHVEGATAIAIQTPRSYNELMPVLEYVE